MELKQARENAGKTVLEVAHALNVSPQAVYRWESGEATPTVSNLVKLSEIYARTVDDLVKGGNNDGTDS